MQQAKPQVSDDRPQEEECSTLSAGRVMEYCSQQLLSAGHLQEYLSIVESVLDENIVYIDPVHQLHGKVAVLEMLARVAPKVANKSFEFELLHDTDSIAVWRWTIVIRVLGMQLRIDGMVHAKIANRRIFYQREYYAPLESLGNVPVLGRLFRWILRLGFV